MMCDLLGAGQVVVYGGGLDGNAALHHQSGLPLPLTGVLVRVVTTPAEQISITIISMDILCIVVKESQ